jgi:hypothetical protein
MSHQCEANKKNGQRCKLLTNKGQYCYAHAWQKGLVVKKSQIPKAQLGLYAVKNFKNNQEIDEYKGEVLRMDMDSIPDNKDYVFSVTNNYHIDAENPNSCLSRYINDPKGTGKRANTKWVVDRVRKRVKIKADRNIIANRQKPVELLIPYGRQYWVEQDRIKRVQIREKKDKKKEYDKEWKERNKERVKQYNKEYKRKKKEERQRQLQRERD